MSWFGWGLALALMAMGAVGVYSSLADAEESARSAWAVASVGGALAIAMWLSADRPLWKGEVPSMMRRLRGAPLTFSAAFMFLMFGVGSTTISVHYSEPLRSGSWISIVLGLALFATSLVTGARRYSLWASDESSRPEGHTGRGRLLSAVLSVAGVVVLVGSYLASMHVQSWIEANDLEPEFGLAMLIVLALGGLMVIAGAVRYAEEVPFPRFWPIRYRPPGAG